VPFAERTPEASERQVSDERSRGWIWLLFDFVYGYSWLLLAAAAAAVGAYAFDHSSGEGIRSIIFFVIPAMWGAFALGSFDARPRALQDLSAPVAIGLGTVAGLVLSSVLFLDTPVSIGNLALGSMMAFFFVMRISSQPSGFSRGIPPDRRNFVLTVLVMLTVLCTVIAAVVE
jgi:hypothetical protein